LVRVTKKLNTSSRYTMATRFIAVAIVLLGAFQDVLAQQAVKSAPVASSIKTIYIVPTSHYDFGFVEPPDAVRERAARYNDDPLRPGWTLTIPNNRWVDPGDDRRPNV
jgi:hypothetical protein